jgi:hypothetical protein
LSRRRKIAELTDCQKDSEGIQVDINVSFNRYWCVKGHGEFIVFSLS